MTLAPELVDRLADAVRDLPGLSWLALHGSRARGEAHDHSDWDFAFLTRAPVDPLDLMDRLARALHDNVEVDVVDVDRASAVLRINVASEGLLIWERAPGQFDDFREQASRFWCDAASVIERAQAQMLAALGPST